MTTWLFSGGLSLSARLFTTMAGKYFILKKYLENGGRPKVCVFLSADYFLEEELTGPDNVAGAKSSLFRPLGSWSNIFDLTFRAKRPDMAKDMLLEGILPSKRLKGPISNWLERLRVYPAGCPKPDTLGCPARR